MNDLKNMVLFKISESCFAIDIPDENLKIKWDLKIKFPQTLKGSKIYLRLIARFLCFFSLDFFMVVLFLVKFSKGLTTQQNYSYAPFHISSR